MNMTDLLPQLHNLSRNEKLKVIKFLVQDLEEETFDDNSLIISEAVFLSDQDWERVTNLISNPPPVNSALVSAWERYKNEVKNQ